jgi:hypothetical protein
MLASNAHLLQHERFGSVQVDRVMVLLDLVFVLVSVSEVRSDTWAVEMLTLAWMSLSLMDDKACWFVAIVSVIWITVFWDVVVVDEMYAQEGNFSCASLEVLRTCDREINEANRCLE